MLRFAKMAGLAILVEIGLWLALLAPFALLALLSMILPAHGQTPLPQANLQQLTESLPSSLQLKDLTAAWRRVRIRSGSTPLVQQGLSDPTNLAPANDVYYTKFQTATVGGATYIIAYRPQTVVDPRDVQRARRPQLDEYGNPVQTRKLPGDMKLTLSLLNVHTIGSLNDIRAFDPKNDVMTPQEKVQEEERAVNEASMSNLKQVALGLMQYVVDFDEVMPPMRPAASEQDVRQAIPVSPGGSLWIVTKTTPVQALLYPYVKSMDVFLHPRTRQPYVPNPSLSYKNLTSIERPAEIAAFYEATPGKDGRRAVAYVDGHVVRVTESEWQRIRRESKVDEPVPVAPPKRTTRARTVVGTSAAPSPPPPAKPLPEAKARRGGAPESRGQRAGVKRKR